MSLSKPITVDEEYRTYTLACGHEVRIEGVVQVYISDTGSHRAVTCYGEVVYIPATFKYFKFKGELVAQFRKQTGDLT